MEEAIKFTGKYLTDTDVSLPKVKDYSYNSIYGDVDTRYNTSKSWVYTEEPPGGEEAVGNTTGPYTGSIFTIKANLRGLKKDALDILTGKFNANNIAFETSRCTVYNGNETTEKTSENPYGYSTLSNFSATSDQKTLDANYFIQLTGVNKIKNYFLNKITDENGKQTSALQSKYVNLLNSVLMYVNAPAMPYYSIEVLADEDIKSTTYDQMINDSIGAPITYALTVPEFALEGTRNNLWSAKENDAITEYRQDPDSYCIPYKSDDKVRYYKNDRRQVWRIKDYKFDDDYAGKEFINLTEEERKKLYEKEKTHGIYFVLHRYPSTANKNNITETVSKEGYLIRDDIYQLFGNATDIRICVSSNLQETDAKQYLANYPERFANPTSVQRAKYEISSFLASLDEEARFNHTGYCMYGQDSYGRVLSVVYIKNKDGVWINLNKYIIAKMLEYGIVSNPKLMEQTLANASFKPADYDIAYSNYQDNFWTMSDTRWGQEKRRIALQLRAFKEAGYPSIKSEDDLYQYTVSIGDVSFFVPPISIRSITETATDRTPLLRAKGSAARSIEKAQTQIELDLYFNNEVGINGQEFKCELWQNLDEKSKEFKTSVQVKQKESSQNKDKSKDDGYATYYMNGLRALVSEFKFTPFLPIVNKYINETLKVSAVALTGINISTVSGFPKLLKATVTLREFDYSVMMPELPQPFKLKNDKGEETEKYCNPLAMCINYDVLRYYYQKPLKKGNFIWNKLKNNKSDYNFASVEFMSDTTYSNRTALMPCEFTDPNIEIYIPNESYLQRLLKVKLDSIKKLNSGVTDNFTPSEAQSEVIKLFGNIYKRIKSTYRTTSDLETSKELNKKIYDIILEIEANNNLDIGGTKLTEYFKVDNTYSDTEYKIQEHILFNIRTDISEYELNTLIAEALAGYANTVDPDKNYSGTDKEQDAIDITYFGDGNKTFYISCLEEASKIKPMSDTMKVLKWCAVQGINLINANKAAQEDKEAADYESVYSMMFDKIDNIRVDGFSASMRNNFASIGTLDSYGSAMQYLGSSDIYIDWQLTTKEADVVNIMKTLPEYEAHCMRRYNVVLPSFPIRINSEFTRMLGVYEVSIESVVVNTMPGFPGVYQISVRTISTDRTIRNRELLRSVYDGETPDPDSGILKYSEGISRGDMRTQLNVRTRDELNSKMALTEVYPDLELPTIGELAKKGFKFLRYKEKARDVNDLYVDPDFYFFYPYTLQSEVYRAVIKGYLDETTDPNVDFNYRLTDINGAQIEFDFANGIKYDTANESAKLAIERRNQELEQRRNENAIYSSRMNEQEKDILACCAPDVGKWNISDKVSLSFMERNYLDIKDIGDKYKNLDTKLTAEDASIGVTDIKSLQTNAQDKDRVKKIKSFYDSYIKDIPDNLKAIMDYLENTPISCNINGMTADNTIEEWDKKCYANKSTSYTDVADAVKDPLKKLYIEISDEIILKNIINSAYATASGSAYYSPYAHQQSNDWKGSRRNYGKKIKKIKTDADKEIVPQNIKNVLADINTKASEIIETSMFKVRKMDYDTLLEFLDTDEIAKLSKNTTRKNKADAYFVLDPYYRLHPEKTIEYIALSTVNAEYAKCAYFRLMLWQIVRFYKAGLFPSLTYDVLQYNAKHSVESNEKVKEMMEKYNLNDNSKSTYQDSAKKIVNRSGTTDNGKFFLAAAVLLSGNDITTSKIYKWSLQRDYKSLNDYLHSLVSNDSSKITSDEDKLFKKYIMALVGYGVINSVDSIGISDGNNALAELSKSNTQIAINACENPNLYIPHSMYDMIRNDYRGRMLRCFPCYLLYFIDEGREVGLWKLHDNYYRINSIADISVVKSKNIAADTCRIILNNNYSTFTMDDEDSTINYKSSWGEMWDNLLNKRRLASTIDAKRRAANRVNKAKLQPGIRIHLRLGYGSDARELGTTFNGIIASVEPNAKMISVVAQGFGIELMNPLNTDCDGDEIQFIKESGNGFNSVAGGGATVKTILESILNFEDNAFNQYKLGHYSPNQSFLKNGGLIVNNASTSFERGLNGLAEFIRESAQSNPFGIRNFGDKYYTDIFSDGERVQNIYEVMNYPKLDDFQSNVNQYDNKIPIISFEPKNKTFFDVLHICKSIAPTYVAAVADFGFRSTVFLGKPHWYYAYDYAYLYDNTLVEKRKPFQQWHVYTSTSDIISNTITADSSKIATVATGLYKYDRGYNALSDNRTVGPLYVDRNIYPEYLKSKIVDTRLNLKVNYWWKKNKAQSSDENNYIVGDWFYNVSGNALKDIGNIFGDAVAGTSDALYDKIYSTFHAGKQPRDEQYKLAWAATADSLKESVKNMYQGGIAVVGDPSVKPQDRILVKDEYNFIEGQCLVKDVIHALNFENGFTTTINVDCIAIVDDRDELVKISGFHKYLMAGSQLALYTSIVSSQYGKGSANVSKFVTALNNNEKMQTVKDISKNTWNKLEKCIPEKYQNKMSALKPISSKVSDVSSKATENAKKLAEKAAAQKIKIISSFTSKYPKVVSGAQFLSKGSIAVSSLPIISALVESTDIDNEYAKGATIAAGTVAMICLSAQFAAVGTAIAVSAFVINGATSIINAELKDLLENYRVLQIFPLFRYGQVYTSGLEGSYGLVYGSPTWEKNGPLEQLCLEYLTPNKEDCYLWKVFKNLTLDEEIVNMTQKLQRDKKVFSSINKGNSVTDELLDSSSLESYVYNNRYCPTFPANRLHQDAYMLSMRSKRQSDNIKNNNEAITAKTGYNRFYIDNINKILNDSTNNSFNLIKKHRFMEKYIYGNYPILEIAHDKLDSSQDEKATQFQIYYHGERTNIKARKRSEKVNGKEEYKDVYDIPYLHEDAIIVLRDILEMAKKSLVGRSDDGFERYSIQNGSKIILTSAMRINSNNIAAGSGFVFSLKGTNKFKTEELKTIADNLSNDITEKIKALKKNTDIENTEYDNPAFKAELKDDELIVTVLPWAQIAE